VALGTGIPVTSGFDMLAQLPVDARFVAADDTARDAIPNTSRFDGLLVYVLATKKMWQLQGGITNSDWEEAGGGGGGGFNATDTITGAEVLDATAFGILLLVDGTSGTYDIELPAALEIGKVVQWTRTDDPAGSEAMPRFVAGAGDSILAYADGVPVPFQGSHGKLIVIAVGQWGLF